MSDDAIVICSGKQAVVGVTGGVSRGCIVIIVPGLAVNLSLDDEIIFVSSYGIIRPVENDLTGERISSGSEIRRCRKALAPTCQARPEPPGSIGLLIAVQWLAVCTRAAIPVDVDGMGVLPNGGPVSIT